MTQNFPNEIGSHIYFFSTIGALTKYDKEASESFTLLNLSTGQNTRHYKMVENSREVDNERADSTIFFPSTSDDG
eukprot:scaffold686_cov177-Ochromonas_danica.AAC.24